MTLKEYYYRTFPSDLALLFRGFAPQEHAGILALGHIWTHSCTLLLQVPAAHRPQFLACLYFTVLVDQGVHTHFCSESRRFEDLTRYPKFRVGLGHPAHLNPVMIFETPIHRGLVAEDAVRRVIPEAMTLFVDETFSFFRDHMPQIQGQDFFDRLLADPDVGSGKQWTQAEVSDCNSTNKYESLRQLLPRELSRAISQIPKAT